MNTTREEREARRHHLDAAFLRQLKVSLRVHINARERALHHAANHGEDE